MKEVNFEFSQIPGYAGFKIRAKVWITTKCKSKSKEYTEYNNIKIMLYTISKIINTMKQNQQRRKDNSNYRYFTCMLFAVIKKLETTNKIKLPLPYYWYVWGPEIEWGSLDEIINRVGYQVKINGVRGKDMPIERLQEIVEHNGV
jgi:hypothetical protein